MTALSPREPLLRSGVEQSPPAASPRLEAVRELARTVQWSISQLRGLHAGIQEAQGVSRAKELDKGALAFASPTRPNITSRSIASSPDETRLQQTSVNAYRFGRTPPAPLREPTTSEGLVPHLDIVQFTAPMYFVEESERKLQVEVMRLGSLQGECKVQYYTEDASAKAGERYKEAKGEITFKKGEHTKPIELRVIADDQWAATLEFKIFLEYPDNCELGQYLYVARVKIIDNDVFPSSKYQDEIEEGEDSINQISGWGLFEEYFRLNLAVPGVTYKTVLILLLDQLSNAYLWLTLYLNVYMVDTLFKVTPETEEELWIRHGPQNGRFFTAILVGLLFILPMGIVHAWEYKKVTLDLEAMSQLYLQTNLFRKYLNYSDNSRSKVPASHMQVAITKETCDVVEGYMSTLELIASVGKLAVLITFILKENPPALLPIVLMPCLMGLWCTYRAHAGDESMEKVAHKTSGVVEIVNEVVQNYTLIADYQQRPQMCDLFSEKTEELCEARLPVELFRLNNGFFPKWLGPIFTGVYIAVQAGAVISGALSVGTFLATVKVFNELSEEFAEGYKQLLKIMASFVPLRKLTHILNMETDLKFWKTVNRRRRELSKMARLEAMQSDDPSSPRLRAKARAMVSPTNGSETGRSAQSSDADAPVFRTDQIQLKVLGMCFAFREKFAFQEVNLECPQGKLVAIIGPHGSGKSTLMRLLGHNLFPDEGTIFIPTHLRILHVSQKPHLLGLSVWKNVTFGRPHEKPPRVMEIVEALKMPSVAALLKENIRELPNQTRKSQRLLRNNHKRCSTMARSSTMAMGDDESDESEDDETEADFGEEPDDNHIPWYQKLSSSDISKIHFIRALVMNPEVLVIHKPTMPYDNKTAQIVLDVLRRHVDNRGFKVAEASRSRRRPRSCFFTPQTDRQAKTADITWNIVQESDRSYVKDFTHGELVDHLEARRLEAENSYS